MRRSWGHFFAQLAMLALIVLVAPAWAQLDDDQWRVDIDTLAENLLDRHPNFFNAHTVEEFEDAIDQIDSRIATLDDQQIAIELSRLVAMGNDAHTAIGFGSIGQNMHRILIRCVVLDDGVFITAADERYLDLVGKQILGIGNSDVDDVIELVSTLFGWENRWKQINSASSFMTLLPALCAVGVVDDHLAETIPIRYRDGSEAHEIEIACSASSDAGAWVNFTQHFEDPMPLMYRKSRGYYQTEFIPDHRAMYLAYNTCREAENLPIADLVAFLLDKSEEFDARRIIIDLRMNGGGDETVLWPLIRALENSRRFEKRGQILTLTSRYTFSSAMSNAQQLRDWAGAVLIGEPTGGKPNHFGAVRSFELPNSGLKVYHSSRYFKKVDGDPDAVHPDIRIDVGSADLFAGRDPVLDAALNSAISEAENDED